MGQAAGSLDEILQFVLLNPSDLNTNYSDCLPLENIESDEVGSSTDKNRDTKHIKDEDKNRDTKNIKDEHKKVSSPARRGRPPSKPLTGKILKERRNVNVNACSHNIKCN